jgi:hypothetical protein
MRLLTVTLAGALVVAARFDAGAQTTDTAPTAATAARRAVGGWNDPRSRALVERATERRAQELADTGLVDYRATARGYLTFLAQVGEGFTEPPRIVKADQLALQVFWRAPNLSKQRIVGRRDTLLLPTDINYHRDHLGIVQNNFPDIIRLGDGDEVLDVPHPLSATGLGEYDFAIRDSLAIRLPDRTIDVIQVGVRPKDDRQPRAIGAVYIERGTGQVVRMAFSFTRSALRDKELEDVSVVLENGLIAGRFWLPRRQEIEIRRTGSWLDYPARGIIRGRWEIAEYAVNEGIDPDIFGGPEIVQAPRGVVQAYPWEGHVLDSLPPDVRAVTDDDVRAVQEEARALVRAQALNRSRTLALSARGVSDFVRVNRVEGAALGAGFTRSLGGGYSIGLKGRWGTADEQAKGEASVVWRRASGAGVRIDVYRSYRDAGDLAETSVLRNSFAAQEFGSDYTDPYDVRGGRVAVDLAPRFGVRWRVEGALESQDALEVHARPANGRYERTIPALRLREARVTLAAERPTALSFLGSELRAHAELAIAGYEPRGPLAANDRPYYGRLFAASDVERPLGTQRLVLRTTLGVVAGDPRIPPQRLVYLGGPLTAPGYDFHELAGRVGASQRVEWRVPVPFPSFPLGRFGRGGGRATIAPYAHVAYVSGSAPTEPARNGWYPSAGVGLLTLFDLLRFDVVRGLRDGRWTFSVDASREFWGIL